METRIYAAPAVKGLTLVLLRPYYYYCISLDACIQLHSRSQRLQNKISCMLKVSISIKTRLKTWAISVIYMQTRIGVFLMFGKRL